jgi:glycosyltransferase involved in cell wall biosynthesis
VVTVRTDGTGGAEAVDGHPSRVLIIVQNLSVPLDRRVWLECQALVAAGHQVSVICPREPGQPRHRMLDGVRIHTYRPPRSASGALGYALEFLYCWVRTAVLSVHVQRREGFDVMQACNPPDTYWLLGLVWRVLGRKAFVFDQHDLNPEVYEARFGRRGLLHRGLLALERATYATADHVIATNESYRRIALTRGRVPRQRTSVVMSAPDPDRMRREAPVPHLRNGREHLVCYLGIMGPQDGVDRLLGAVHHFVHVLGRRDTHFGLLGFGDCLEDLKEQSVRLDLTEYVTFTGKVGPDEIGRWLSTAALGVTPDPKNPFNDMSTMNKTLEYMAHELPVVSFDLTENAWSAGEAGLRVTEDDDAALARAIAELLDDPPRRARMGAIGRKRIEEHLHWGAQAEEYVRVFREHLARHRGQRPGRVSR